MFIADLHIHSKYSRATSKQCNPEMLDLWARRKGLDLIGTGDFTHAMWREELKTKLEPAGEGVYTLKDAYRQSGDWAPDAPRPHFVLSGEISSIYKKNGRVRKVHNVILLPGLEAAEALAKRLGAIGNLHSDGRPILGLDSHDLLEITLETAPEAVFIPAHIWTPHFSLFGAYSGFDSIDECFGDLTGHIHALETGLSSDPPMNWRVSELDKFTLVSNSDAHSPAKLAREANLFDSPLTFPHISKALSGETDSFKGTLEFFPQEGKYHLDGHRKCSVCQKPSKTIASSGICPVCGKRITVGVLHRIEDLADRDEDFVRTDAPAYERLVPLPEIIADSLGMTTASKKVAAQYQHVLTNLGPELYILREAPIDDIERTAGALLAEGIRRLRAGEVNISPGFDGEYGKINIFDPDEIRLHSGQLCFFDQVITKNSALESTQKHMDAPESVSEKSPDDAPASSGTVVSGHPYGLNPEQWLAVSAEEPAVSVSAGPGTGKTRTLISRIAYLVENRGVDPAHITAVTFTNKSADAMRTRLKEQLGTSQSADGVSIGTFHSICLKYLQGIHSRMAIIDEAGALRLLSGILADLGISESARDMLHKISLYKNGALSAADADFPTQVFNRYSEALSQYGLLDFDDILTRALALFESGTIEDTTAFRHLMVDEFQDINPVQYRLIRAWSKTGADVFIIGDPDQSIYGFRGASPRCFTRFLTDYPAVKQITLTRNYRSTPEIITCAHSFISRNLASAPDLMPSRASGAKVRLLNAENAFSEALFVAKEISRVTGGLDMLEAHASGENTAKYGLSDIAILYRTNRQARAIESCLLKADIPYVVAGRDRYLDDPQVRQALAFFEFLSNPHDILSLAACIEAYIQPADRIDEILKAYAASDRTLSALGDLLHRYHPDLTDSSGELSDALAKYAAMMMSPPAELIAAWADDRALNAHDNLRLLINTAVMHSHMPSFLKTIKLGRDSDIRRSGTRSYPLDAVSLMTLHSAKGLEFPVVFLCGISDGLIPFHSQKKESDLDEERRLFFVGMTRAKDMLFLLTSPAGSPFLDELPKEHIESGDTLPPHLKAKGKQLRFW